MHQDGNLLATPFSNPVNAPPLLLTSPGKRTSLLTGEAGLFFAAGTTTDPAA